MSDKQESGDPQGRRILSAEVGSPLAIGHEVFQVLAGSGKQDRLVKLAQDSADRFPARLAELASAITPYHPLDVLSFFSFYSLTGPPTTSSSSELPRRLLQHHVEFLQALFMTIPPEQLGQTTLTPDRCDVIEDMAEAVFLDAQFRGLSPEGLSSPSQFIYKDAIEEARTYAATVRIYAHPEELLTQAERLFAPFDAALLTQAGVTFTDLVQLVPRLVALIEDRLNAYRAQVRKLFQTADVAEVHAAYAKICSGQTALQEHRAVVDRVECDTGRRMTVEQLRTYYMLCTHHELPGLYTIAPQDFAALCPPGRVSHALPAVFDEIALSFGELAGDEPEHFFLSNPILTRPAIRLGGDCYFLPIVASLIHSLPTILHDVATAYQVSIDLRGRRSEFLQSEAEQVLISAFPNAEMHSGSLWTDPGSGVEFENDVLLVLDKTAVVFELKSGQLTESGRRAAPMRFSEKVDNLILEPGRQANRFVAFLLAHPGRHRFTTKRGVTNAIDTTECDRFLRLAVTLEHLGPIAGNTKRAIAAGLGKTPPDPPVPAMTLADLRLVLDVLPDEAQRIHYFARRNDLEARTQFSGEESDLLAFYVDNGFCIGEAEADAKVAFRLLGMDRSLDPYRMWRWEKASPVRAPQRQLTQWWQDMLARLGSARPRGWTLAAHALLCVSHEEQVEVEESLTSLMQEAKHASAGMERYLLVRVGVPADRHVILFVPLPRVSSSERRDILGSRMTEAGSRESAVTVVAIGIPYQERCYPYGTLAAASVKALAPEDSAREGPERDTGGKPPNPE
jgi:hypothetical protein